MSAYPITEAALQRLQQLITEATAISAGMRQSGPACVRVDAYLIMSYLVDAADMVRDAAEVLQLQEQP